MLLSPLLLALLHQHDLGGTRCRPLEIPALIDEHVKVQDIERLKKDADDEKGILNRATFARLSEMLLKQTATAAPKSIKKGSTIDAEMLEATDKYEWWKIAVKDDKRQADLEALKAQYDEAIAVINRKFEDRVQKVEAGDELAPGAPEDQRPLPS